jgi:hypothetical protein
MRNRDRLDASIRVSCSWDERAYRPKSPISLPDGLSWAQSGSVDNLGPERSTSKAGKDEHALTWQVRVMRTLNCYTFRSEQGVRSSDRYF